MTPEQKKLVLLLIPMGTVIWLVLGHQSTASVVVPSEGGSSRATEVETPHHRELQTKAAGQSQLRTLATKDTEKDTEEESSPKASVVENPKRDVENDEGEKQEEKREEHMARQSGDENLPVQCETNRFLYIGNTFGRHNNQLTSLINGIQVAKKLRRTLVVTPFSDGSASANKNGKAKRVEVDEWYDLNQLFEKECIILERDWWRLVEEDIPVDFHDTEKKNDPHRPKKHIPAACITMRGIKTHPQQPLGTDSRFHCASEHFVKYKKKADLFYEVANTGLAKEARVLTVPLVIYLSDALTFHEQSQPWRWFKPKPIIEEYADKVVKAMRSASSSTSGGETGVCVTVHMRSLEGSCQGRVKDFIRGIGADIIRRQKAVTDQCELRTEYIHSVVKTSLAALREETVGSSSRYTFALAHDFQQPRKVKSLIDAFSPNSLELSWLTDPKTVGFSAEHSSSRNFDALREIGKELVGVTQRVVQGRGNMQRDPRDPFTRNPQMFRLMIDFWVMVKSDIFLGNQLSTLSMNVCRARFARGLKCDNFPDLS